MQVAIVGSGYVGLVAGACFADLGHQVILVDNDQAKLAALNAGEVPIHEKFLPELLKRHRGHNLKFSDDDYAWVTARIAAVAARHAKGRIVSTLEGGYSLSALGRSAAAHVRTLIGS